MSMLNSLPHGVKISVTRSINTAFEQYMAKIMWDEESYDPQDFIKEWRHYIHHKASWYNQIDEELKNDPSFHEELAQKINEVVEKTFSEEPTADQIETIDALQEELGTNYDYSCKAEARFYIDFLKNSIKKKSNS